MVGNVMSGSHRSPEELSIKPHDVHVYDIDLAVNDGSTDLLFGLLDSREREQANRFVTSELRRRHILSHGHLRIILGRYLGVTPEEVVFVQLIRGKPALDPVHGSPVTFNLSHSGDKCLVAVATERDIGIDVERVRPLAEWREIAQRFFSQRETARLSELPPELTEAAFFATWTRKEAYIKALGLGMALDLGAFEVEVDPRQESRLIWALDASEGPSAWCMRNVPVAPGYHAALAVRDDTQSACVLCTDWPTLSRA
jgi:4'-phosphopantetheinyl transferase